MRMRFWPTMRRPAFSITALTAPVRLRSVASGLMIENVRSIAMISSLNVAAGYELRGLYRRLRRTASDPRNTAIGASPQGKDAGITTISRTRSGPVADDRLVGFGRWRRQGG